METQPGDTHDNMRRDRHGRLEGAPRTSMATLMASCCMASAMSAALTTTRASPSATICSLSAMGRHGGGPGGGRAEERLPSQGARYRQKKGGGTREGGKRGSRQARCKCCGGDNGARAGGEGSVRAEGKRGDRREASGQGGSVGARGGRAVGGEVVRSVGAKGREIQTAALGGAACAGEGGAAVLPAADSACWEGPCVGGRAWPRCARLGSWVQSCKIIANIRLCSKTSHSMAIMIGACADHPTFLFHRIIGRRRQFW